MVREEKLKKRIIIAGCVLFLAAGFLLPQLAADSHYFFLKEFRSMTLRPSVAWPLVLGDSRVQKFYLIYLAITALLLIWVLVTGSYLNYRSDMQQITPDIATPCAAGQGQYGTARWMKPEDIGRSFGVWKLPKRRSWFRELIAAGKQDYKEVQNSDVKVDSYDSPR